MSEIKVTNKEHNVAELEFSASKEAFDAALDRQFKKNLAKMTVPGFRRGKAPRHVVEKLYGKGIFHEEAINDILPDAYEAAVKEAGLDIVGRPEFDVTAIDENGVAFKATCTLKPTAEVKAYTGLEATRTVRPVTDEEVDAELGRVQNRNSRMVEISDRAAQNGDTVSIDFDGTVDGVAFEGGHAEGYTLKLGSGTFIPGYEDQIVGHSVNDEFDVNVTFPENYSTKELAGKPAVFRVKLHEIKMTELPALDDEFAKDVSEFDTLAEYKADIKAKLEEKNAKEADNNVESQLIDALLANTEVEVPEVMIDAETENVIRDRDYDMRAQGLDLNTFLKYTNQTLDDMRTQVRPYAERQVKTRLALETVVKAEAITATEEDIEAEYKKFSDAYSMPVEDIKKSVASDMLTENIAMQKAVALSKEKANVTEKAYEAPEAATEEKKPAAKKRTTKKATAEKAEKTAEKTIEEGGEAERPAPKKRTSKKAAPKAEEDKAE